jgi:FkbM family methyltransferase
MGLQTAGLYVTKLYNKKLTSCSKIVNLVGITRQIHFNRNLFLDIKEMRSDAEKQLSALEQELTAFVKVRTPAFLQDIITAGCFVYGAGGFGQRVIALLQEQNVLCHGVIDKKFSAKQSELNGIPAYNPASFKNHGTQNKCLIIGTHNHLVDLSEIMVFGKAHGFKDILLNTDLPDALGPKIDNYWLTNRRFLLDNFEALRKVAQLFDDQKSIETLVSLIKYRVKGDITSHPSHDLNEQYLPPGIMAFNKPITFVDGGAYDGDTLRHLTAKGVEVTHWIAFEPDPGNFALLSKHAKKTSKISTLFPCGLNDSTKHLSFEATAGTSSHLSNSTGTSTMIIPCVALDDVIQGLPVDYIKLDIEGAEQDALLGMRKTISAYQPNLAVSTYHKPEDLWAIPNKMHELSPNSKLYLRQHDLNAFETVTYAV